jgi:hypothetical protein
VKVAQQRRVKHSVKATTPVPTPWESISKQGTQTVNARSITAVPLYTITAYRPDVLFERLDLNCVKVKEKNFPQHPDSEQSRHCHSGGDGLLFWLSVHAKCHVSLK